MSISVVAAIVTYCATFLSSYLVFWNMGSRIHPAKLAAWAGVGPALMAYAWIR